MTLRTAAMNLNSDQTSERWHLVRKIVLLSLSVIALALGLAILYRYKASFPLVLFNLLADISLGLIAGLGARFVLSQRHWFIQASASAAMAVIGLILLGYLTNWMSGIGPLQAGLVQVYWLDAFHIPLQLPLQFEEGKTNWLDLAYMVIAIDISWIALRVWKHQYASAVEQPVNSSINIRNQKRPRISHDVTPAAYPLVRARCRFPARSPDPKSSGTSLSAR